MELGDLPGWGALALSVYTLYRSAKAEKRAETTAKSLAYVADMKSDITRLKELSFRYWLAPDNGDTPTALDIKALLKTIPNKAKRHPDCNALPLIQADLIRLRKAISGGDFEVIGRPALKNTSPRLVQMGELFASITSQLESL